MTAATISEHDVGAPSLHGDVPDPEQPAAASPRRTFRTLEHRRGGRLDTSRMARQCVHDAQRSGAGRTADVVVASGLDARQAEHQ